MYQCKYCKSESGVPKECCDCEMEMKCEKCGCCESECDCDD